MLAINLWNTKPTNINYYNSNNKNNIIIDNTNINNKINISHCISDNLFKKITVDKDLINFNLFEKLLYKKEINLFLEFGKLINKDELLIDNSCENVIACFSPVAIDLRFVLATLKINYHFS
jgi:hypothetical protein